MDQLGRLYTVDETAKFLNVDTNTIYKWIGEKKLNAIKLGGTTWRIIERDLKFFLFQTTEEGGR